MKRMLALILALILLFVLSACGTPELAEEKAEEKVEEALPDPVIGSWILTGLELEGADVSAYSVQFDIRMEFRPDGSGTVTSGEDSFSVTWQNGAFYDGRERISYTVKGDTLSFLSAGMTFLFTRA
ncbi:MAG: hypothetical protein IJQ42_10610 [Oscillospiraceae bacterium]|nr:hypothetical protein [Oscillospiraceae bacterium]